MIQINKDSFKNEVVNFKGVVVADFYADWCGPCKMLSPLMEEMNRENKEKDVKFVKINVDENSELAGLFGVMSIPTVIIFKEGVVVGQQIGVSTKEAYLELINKAKNQKKDKSKGSNKVTVFTTPTCPYCHMVKEYLNEKKVAFKEIDVSKDQESAMKMVQKSGQMGVPQLWIGDEVVIGFNKPQIDIILGI